MIQITPNLLTLLRVILAFVTFYLLMHSYFWMRLGAFGVFTVAALTDLWDGQLARRSGRVTDFGKILDPIADKILILGVFLCFISLNVYPLWAVIPIFVREVSVTVYRLYLLRKNVVVAAERSGKIKVVVQMISLAVSFFYLMDREYTSGISGWPGQIHVSLFWASYLGLAAATYFSLISGWDFFRKNIRRSYA
ncbi:MAG: CDP-diacylglycerol--glycerol-3-phosphate 3-phosphatidyltransferase [Candidatus Omnitrophica bacterium]|nr:CDP-diacylglycerol--glycerol-3-phosphate 3-phosphatidyltransferase [Candidatus Omnitrophota bacterium]